MQECVIHPECIFLLSGYAMVFGFCDVIEFRFLFYFFVFQWFSFLVSLHLVSFCTTCLPFAFSLIVSTCGNLFCSLSESPLCQIIGSSPVFVLISLFFVGDLYNKLNKRHLFVSFVWRISCICVLSTPHPDRLRL